MTQEISLIPTSEEFKIKTHNIDRIIFNYPVGEYLQEDLPKMMKMANDVAIIIRDTIGEAPLLNLIVRGSSGAIMGTVFLQRFLTIFTKSKIKIIHVKKDGETSHANPLHEFDFGGLNIFVDDVVSSGNTVYKTLEAIKEATDKNFSFDWLIVGSYITKTTLKKFTENKVTKHIISKIYQ